jgi:hypothetical protein
MKIDNQALMIIINKRTSQSKYVMQLIRPFVLLTMCNNVQLEAVHLSGVNNELADSLLLELSLPLCQFPEPNHLKTRQGVS